MSYELLFAGRAEIEEVQATYFAEMMDLVATRHPYYSAMLAGRDLRREDFGSLADLSRLPVTTKLAYMAAPEQFTLQTDGLAEEMRTVWDVMYTTGTSAGRPTPFVSTTYDFYRILELQRNMLRLRGVGADDVIANLFPVTRAPHGAWIRVLHAAASLNISVVSTMPGRPSEFFSVGNDTDEVVRIIARSRASVLWGVPSYIARVIERAIALGADFSAVRMVFVTGEGLGEAARSELVANLARVGAQAAISISYGSTETQGGMVECVAGAGYHNPAPDQIHIEMVDPQTQQPVADGEPGLVVITHLQRRGTVLIRYSLGDLSVRTREPCPHCGASTDRLIAMPRRADALVKVRGMLVNPAVLIEVLERELGARPFLVSVEGGGTMDLLRVRFAQTDAMPRVPEQIGAKVREAIGVSAIVEVVPVEALVDPAGTWKMKKFVDQRAPK
jgi:phenylacetate-CoA ligase